MKKIDVTNKKEVEDYAHSLIKDNCKCTENKCGCGCNDKESKLSHWICMVLLLVFIIGLVYVSINSNKKPKGELIKHIQINVNYKDSVINFIKNNEKFRNKTYICAGGYPTIGYGHKIIKGEKFKTITEPEADALLRSDFEKAIKYAGVQNNQNKQLAIAHFIFSLGIGNYQKSGLKKKVDNNEYIGNELIKWCYFNKDSFSIGIMNNRLYELELYYK